MGFSKNGGQTKTFKKAKSGQTNNSPAYIYIYIYMYVVESKIGPKIAFFGVKLVQVFFFFPFCFSKIFFLQGEWDKKRKKEDTNTIFESNIDPIMLRNMLGPIYDSTLDQCLTQPFWHFLAIFPFSKYAETTRVIVITAKNCMFKPTPPKLGTLFVNTIALAEKHGPFSAFLFWGFLLCPFFIFFCPFCWRWMNNKKQNNQKKKQYHKMQTTKPPSLSTKKEARQQT